MAGLTSAARWAAIEGGTQLALAATTGGSGNAVRITGKGAAHVLARHFPGGAKTAGKSLFNAVENVTDLARGADGISPVVQANGNLRRVVTAGRDIGIDRATSSPTNVYTVITNKLNELVTMFPGISP